MDKDLLFCQLNGLKFNYLGKDRFVGQRVVLGKYEPYETKLMLEQVKEGDIVVDVGANIGYYTLLLAQKVGAKGKVYAFEPEKMNFEILKKNVEENGLKNVRLFEMGAGDMTEARELVLSEENLGDHRIKNPLVQAPPSPTQGTTRTEKVNIVRLNEAVKEKVDLIKIDTQGYEPMVIEGAKELIEKYKPQIFMEYMPAYKESGGDGVKMMEYLSKIYKKINIIDDYLFAYYRGKLPIDKYCNNKKGYTDVWLMNRDINYIDSIKRLRINKLVRKVLGLPQTG